MRALTTALVLLLPLLGVPASPSDARPLAVRDAKGKVVGLVNGPAFPPWDVAGVFDTAITPVVRRIGKTSVQFNIDALGLRVPANGNPIPEELEFLMPDCAGDPLVIVDRNALLSSAWAEGDVFRYAILPGSARTWQSVAFFITDGSPCVGVVLPAGRCCVNKPAANKPKNLADTAVLDLTALGLVSPFHVEGP